MTQTSVETVQILVALQRLDSTIQALEKNLESLPQKQKILDVRHRREEVSKSMRKMTGMRTDAHTSLSDLAAEEGQLVAKQRSVQQAMSLPGVNFRKSKECAAELELIGQRMEEISQQRDKLETQILQIDDLFPQAASSLEKLDAQERELIGSYKSQGGRMIEEINRATAQKRQLASRLDGPTLSKYDKLIKAKGGVAVCLLEQGTCSVCHSRIDPTRVLRLRSEYPLAVCPSCGRLMVVDQPYRG